MTFASVAPRIIVNNYGFYYPRGYYPGFNIINKPLRTEVVFRPEDYLTDLDTIRDWVGLSGTDESDRELEDLLETFSDYICGPNSMTNKCFRTWKLADFFEVRLLSEHSRIYLSYPIVQSLENVIYTDILGENNFLDQSKYRLVKQGLKKSYIVILEDIEFDEENNTELQIVYNCSANLDQYNKPVIDKRIIQAVKHYINDSFYKRGVQLGPFEGAGVSNKLVENLLKTYLY